MMDTPVSMVLNDAGVRTDYTRAPLDFIITAPDFKELDSAILIRLRRQPEFLQEDIQQANANPPLQ